MARSQGPPRSATSVPLTTPSASMYCGRNTSASSPSATDRASRLWLRLSPGRYEVWVDGTGTNAGPDVLRVR